MTHPLARDLDHILDHTRSIWRDLNGTRLFLTGGTGFVGTWLLDSLGWANQRLGVDVRAVALTRDPAAFRRRSPEIAGYPAISYLTGDARTFEFPDGEFATIIHASTEKQFEPDEKFPAGMFPAEIASTNRTLEFAASHGAGRFLLTSSGAVYGKQPSQMPHIDEDYAGAPLTTELESAYGQAKRVSEWLCFMYGRQFQFAVMAARLFAFIGPRLPLERNFAAGNFIRDALAGGPVRIGGDGTPFRSYLYAADLAIWLLTILVNGEGGTVYNVGSPEPISIYDLARMVVEVAGRDISIHLGKRPLPGQLAPRYIPLTKRAESQLGLRQWVTLREGIGKTYEWNRNSP